jgi:hypothetical protein
VSLALVTAATKVCVAPSTTDALLGVIVTLMEGAGGGGGVSAAELAPVPAQPTMHALAARTAARRNKADKDVRVCNGNAIAKFLAPPLERGRISAEMQAKGQTKKRGEQGDRQVRADRLKFVSPSNAKALAHIFRSSVGA